jgi:hypothetical protein
MCLRSPNATKETDMRDRGSIARIGLWTGLSLAASEVAYSGSRQKMRSGITRTTSMIQRQNHGR